MFNIEALTGLLQQGLSFVIVFGLLVFVHELGHFMLARLNGIHVYEFAIGMGKAIYSYQGKETKYSVRIFPIGGYVNMMGENEESDDPSSFSSKSPMQRFSVLFAGPFMNFVLALLIFVLYFGYAGVPVNVVGEVIDGYPAQEAGIKVGDRIIDIESTPIKSWNDVIMNIALNSDKDFDLTFIREGVENTVTVRTLVTEEGRQIIGIVPRLDKAPGMVVQKSFEEFTSMMKAIFGEFSKLFRGKAQSENFVGPVGIIGIIGEASQYGVMPLMQITAILSVNLGFINLLPFPALDGGRLVFVLYEMIFRKPFNQEKEQTLHYIGFVLLLVLMVFLITRDIINL